MSASPLCVAERARTTRLASERDARIEDNLELVAAVSRQVAAGFPRHVDREELIRAGMVGLVEAAGRFDGTLGVPFRSFAARRVRGAMIDSMRAYDWAPRSVRSDARLLAEVEGDLTNRLGRTPTDDELAAAAGMTGAQAADVRHCETRAAVLTLDTFFDGDEGDGGSGFGDVLHDMTVPDPAERLELAELHADVQHAVSKLPARHRRIVVGYFYEGLAGDDLAAELGVSVSRVSQLKGEALAMLRDGLLFSAVA